MKRPQELAIEEQSMASLVQLTSVFESIASIKIAQIKNKVLQSQQFFNELWHIYSQIRVDGTFRFGRDPKPPIIYQEDERAIIVRAAIIILEGSLENSAWSTVSWRDNEISFSNLESGRMKSANLRRLWEELLSLLTFALLFG